MRISHQATPAKFQSALQEYQNKKWECRPNKGGIEAKRDISTLRQAVSIVCFGILYALTFGKKFKSDLDEAKKKIQVVQLVCDDKQADIRAIYEEVTGSSGDSNQGTKRTRRSRTKIKQSEEEQEDLEDAPQKSTSSTQGRKQEPLPEPSESPVVQETPVVYESLQDKTERLLKEDLQAVYPLMDRFTIDEWRLFTNHVCKLPAADINTVDFVRIGRKLSMEKFVQIFGGDTRYLGENQKERIKNLNVENLTELLRFFNDTHTYQLTPDQISAINFKTAFEIIPGSYHREKFNDLFDTFIKDKDTKAIQQLDDANIKTLQKFFGPQHLERLTPEQRKWIDRDQLGNDYAKEAFDKLQNPKVQEPKASPPDSPVSFRAPASPTPVSDESDEPFFTFNFTAPPPAPSSPAHPPLAPAKEPPVEETRKREETPRTESVINEKMTVSEFERIFGSRSYSLSEANIKRVQALKGEELNIVLKFFRTYHTNALLPDQIPTIDFKKAMEGLEYYKKRDLLQFLFGDRHGISDSQKERAQKLKGGDLNILLGLFDDKTADSISPDQIPTIDFKKAMEGLEYSKKRDLLQYLFGDRHGISDSQKERAQKLKGEDLNILLGLFDYKSADSISPAQIPTIDFKKVIEGLDYSKKKDLFRYLFGDHNNDISESQKERAQKLKGEDLNILLGLFDYKSADSLSPDQIPTVDFKKAMEGLESYKKRDFFRYLFGDSEGINEQQKKRFQAIKDVNVLIDFTKYFIPNHWKILNNKQFELLVQNKKRLSPETQDELTGAQIERRT